MVKKLDNSRILVLSDMHAPYMHRDTVAFLAALARKYKPTRIICMGDEADKHAMSFHDSDPDLDSAGPELSKAIKKLAPIYELFPRVDVLESNHGSMHYRKGKHHGIPRKYLRDYQDILEAPPGWKWHTDLYITLPNGVRCFFHHGLSSDIIQVVKARGVCTVQGHYHSEMGAWFVSTPDALLWGLQVGCSIDKKSLAFAYDNANLPRPIIAHGMIIDSLPRPMPMLLTKAGRWNGYVP